MTGDTSSNGGSVGVPPPDRLLRFAEFMGAGPDAEDLVREALRAASGPGGPDPHQVWPHLANLLAERSADRYRQLARAQILLQHRVLVPPPPALGNDLATCTEASWTARQLVALLPRDVLDLLWRHHVGGASWTELAARRRVSPDALRRQVHQALHAARRRIGIGRVV
ncbi:MAG: hypothetical protein ACRDT2_00700 [Natronosporangium sp.]